MANQLQGNTATTPFDPRLPTDSGDLLQFRRPRPPAIFSVQIGVIGETLVFVIGDDPSGIGRVYNVSRYEIYFTEHPEWIVIASDSRSGNTRTTGGELVGQVAAVGGGKVVFTDHNFYFRRGWFFVVSVIGADFRSVPSNFIRSPSLADIVTAAVPPNVGNQAVSKTSQTINGRTISVVKVSATIPSESKGVVAIAVTNGGTGYTTAPTVTVGTAGLGTGGVAATAEAFVSPQGEVREVRIVSTGGPYSSAPLVTFGGPGTGAVATAVLGFNTAFDGFQIYLTNYFGEAQVESQFFAAGSARAGDTISGTMNLFPDPAHTTTFTFVSVSAAGSRNPAGAPTATLIV